PSQRRHRRARRGHARKVMMRTRSLAALAVLLLAVACKEKPKPVVYQAVPAEKRSIVVSARATGTIQPDTVVEVKSKASGEILDMKVETGQTVERATLLGRGDQRTPKNTLEPRLGDLEVGLGLLQGVLGGPLVDPDQEGAALD